MKRLNIFVDETGEFGFEEGKSELYGVSFTFHEQDDDIMTEVNKLNNRLDRIGYTNMIHMADLIMRRGDYRNFDIAIRKSIFNAIYQFSRRIKVKYKTIYQYRYKTRTLIQKAGYSIKWSNSDNDTALINDGYKYTGNKKVKN